SCTSIQELFLLILSVLHHYYIHLFLFSLLRPPLTSTLFPYTTLFRSRRLDRDRVAYLNSLRVRFRGHRETPYRSGKSRRRSRRQDRKSTRLNSSHDQISYAVFCLKKKTTSNIDKLVTKYNVKRITAIN